MSKTRAEWVEFARSRVERHLEGETPEELYDEAYTLAYDALHDEGASDEERRQIATEIADEYEEMFA